MADRSDLRAATFLAIAILLAFPIRSADPPGGVSVVPGSLDVTIGDPIPLDIGVDLQEGETFDPVAIGPELGPFRVLDGAWRRPSEAAPRSWVWSGTVAAYRTGELTLPAFDWTVGTPDGTRSLTSPPITIRVDSVLPAGEDPATLDIAEIKDVVAVAPDWSALRLALVALAGLVVAAGALAWAHRRWAARLAAATAPPDPFERLPPHEWAFRELKALLERRLHEQGRVDEFHAEVARIVKRYLGGRYRVDLMERTTAEVGPALAQGGANQAAVRGAAALLVRCDTVKFAGARPDAERCRGAVEDAYRLVDATRPVVDPAQEAAS